jgi:hypothetical protein
MEYSDIVWDNIPDYLKQSLESLQLEAARIVTGATKLTSRQLLYDETGWGFKYQSAFIFIFKLLSIIKDCTSIILSVCMVSILINL